MFGVSDASYDRQPVLLFQPGPARSRTDRVAPFEQLPGEALSHDSDVLAILFVLTGEVAAPHERNVHGAEIVRTDLVGERLRLVTDGHGRLAIDHQRVVDRAARQGKL